MKRALVVSGGLACLTTLAGAQNLLQNPSFEDDLNGWIAFGNVFVESANPPQFDPFDGDKLVSMFGNFSGGFNVSGLFQEFPAGEGDQFELSVHSRHFSGDAMVGDGAPDSNWAVAKIAFFDGGGTEIGAAEVTILDGTFPTDVWHFNSVQGTAPAGTASVQALLLYLQPAFDGGAAHVDAASFTVVPAPGAGALLAIGGLLAMRRRR